MAWLQGIGDNGATRSARGSNGKQGVMVGRKRWAMTPAPGQKEAISIGDARRQWQGEVVVVLETASLPALRLSTSTSQDPAKNPKMTKPTKKQTKSKIIECHLCLRWLDARIVIGNRVLQGSQPPDFLLSGPEILSCFVVLKLDGFQVAKTDADVIGASP